MRKSWVKKSLVCGIILLFVGTSVVPSISGDFNKKMDSNNDLSGRGGNILVYSTTSVGGDYDKTFFDTDLPTILGNHGYSVTVTDRSSTPEITSSLLSAYDEFWFLSAYPPSVAQLSQLEINTILNFRNQGHGLLIMADGNANSDYSDDANQISVPLGVTFSGSTNHGVNGQPIYPIFSQHPLFLGVNSIAGHESESKIVKNNPVQVVATYTGNNLIAILDNGNGRVVFDVSWTRLWDNQILVGDTPQYVRNIADWLKSRWSIETVDSTGQVGRFTSLALDSNNKPHISYYNDTSGDLKYAWWDGSSWHKTTVDSIGNVGLYTSIALDSNNRPHISYYNSSSGDLKYAWWDGSSWHKTTVDSIGNVGKYTSISLDSYNWPHISYYNSSSGDLKYAWLDGTSWHNETVDSIGDVGYFTSIALDSNNWPHISYYDNTNKNLMYAKWTGALWSKGIVDYVGSVGSGQFDALLDSLALDSNDQPHVCYHDWVNRDLKYAKWSGTSWDKVIVNSSGLAGMYPSIALDSNNQPHISHYEGNNNDLKYAWLDGTSWHNETVDSVGGVGHFSSIALDSNDQPCISYYDITNGDLKYAKYTSTLSGTGFWVEVDNTDSTLAIRQDHTTQSQNNIYKRVPDQWVLQVIDTHQNQIVQDGYIWWEVKDTTDGVIGWAAYKNIDIGTIFLVEGNQGELQSKTINLPTPNERLSVILETEQHYYTNEDSHPSLYSSGDKDKYGSYNNFPIFQNHGFTENLILSIIAQESEGIGYDNTGDGIMQITGISNRGWGTRTDCRSTNCKYYSNTKLGIYANIKDGFRVLQYAYTYCIFNNTGCIWRYNAGGQPYWTYYFYASMIDGVWRYGGDADYLGNVADEYVAHGYGDETSEVVKQMRAGQTKITETLNQIEEKQGKTIGEIHDILHKLYKGEKLEGNEKLIDIKYQISIFTGGLDKSEVWIPGDSLELFHLKCPELRVYDSGGNVTGLVNGMIKEEIRNSVYDKENETILLFLPFDSYYYEIVGTENGTYGATALSFQNETSTNFTATDIPIFANATHHYIINWSTLSQGEKGVVVQMDNDGDGTFEQSYTTDDTFHFPIANFTFSPTMPFNNQTIFFDASSSVDPDGYIVNWTWDFGNGNVSNNQNTTHQYGEVGNYTVTLTVRDDDDATNTTSKKITIKDGTSPRIVDNTLLVASTGDLFTFNTTVTDNVAVSSVWVEYWYGTGNHTIVSMTNNTRDYWEKTITIANTLDTLHYIISTNDTSNNWNSTGIKNVTINDNDNPELTNVHAIPLVQVEGGYVNISAIVTDNIAVNQVYLTINNPNTPLKSYFSLRGTIENFSIAQNKTGDTYYCNKTYHQLGIYTYHIWANDTSGNTILSVDYSFDIIDQPPYTPSDPNPEDGAVNLSVNASLNWIGGDPDPSDTVTYDVFFGTTSPPPQVISNQTGNSYNPSELDYSTTYYWRIVAWDNHSASTSGLIWHFTTVLDTIPPVTSISFEGTLGDNGWYTSPVNVTLTATDSQSDVTSTMYKIDSGSWTTYSAPFVVSEDGNHTISYYSIDKVGNMETSKTANLKIDQTPPIITLTKEQIDLFNVKFTAEVSDETSGIDRVEFALDGVMQYNDTQSPYEWTWTGFGNHQVTATVFDKAGHSKSQSMSTPVEQIQAVKTVQLQIIQQLMEMGLRKQLLA